MATERPSSPGAELGAIESFEPRHHQVGGFSSGSASVDNLLKRTAKKAQATGNLRFRVFVEDDRVLGYYATRAATLQFADLPELPNRYRSKDGSLPALMIAMIGVDVRHQSRRIGRYLLVDALYRALEQSGSVGFSVVFLDILDDGDRSAIERRKALYRDRFGFKPLADDPMRMAMTVAQIRKLFGVASGA